MSSSTQSTGARAPKLIELPLPPFLISTNGRNPKLLSCHHSSTQRIQNRCPRQHAQGPHCTHIRNKRKQEHCESQQRSTRHFQNCCPLQNHQPCRKITDLATIPRPAQHDSAYHRHCSMVCAIQHSLRKPNPNITISSKLILR